MVNTGCNGKNAQWRVLAGGYNDFTVLIYPCFPSSVQSRNGRSVPKLLTPVLTTGCRWVASKWTTSGHIHFKTTLPYDKEVPQVEALDMLLGLNLSTMDRYLPAIMSVIYAGTTPAKALMGNRASGKSQS